MLTHRVIPCLDVDRGRVVKGVRFVDLRDAGDPAACAAAYDRDGADELCFLDISASHEGRATMIDVVEKTAERCFMPMTVGGGVATLAHFRDLLAAGADKVAINTAAIARRRTIAEAASRFGSQCVVVAVDARRRERDDPSRGWEVFTHGGRKATGLDAVAYIVEAATMGAGEILLTSMDCDGVGEGFDIPLLQAACAAVSTPVIASGGVGTLEHLTQGVRDGGASAVLAASIFHFGVHTIAEAKAHMAAAGLPMRL